MKLLLKQQVECARCAAELYSSNRKLAAQYWQLRRFLWFLKQTLVMLEEPHITLLHFANRIERRRMGISDTVFSYRLLLAERHKLANVELASTEPLADLNDFFDAERRSRNRLEHALAAALDST